VINFRWLTTIASAAILAFFVAACGSDEGGLSGGIVGAGTTSQQVAQEAWIANFESENSGVTISYDPVGSGGGVEQFSAGVVAYAGTDAAVSAGTLKGAILRCEGDDGVLIEIPAFASPIAIVYNLPEVESLKLSPKTLAKIFSREITSWDDEAIAADNPGTELPDTRIVPVHRSDRPDATEDFTEHEPEAVAARAGAIGYADASRAGENQIARVEAGGEFVEPTPEAAAKTLAEAPEDSELRTGEFMFPFALDRKTEAVGAYPGVLVSYLLACTRYESQGEAEIAKRYLEYAISPRGQEAAAENAGSAPLPAALTKKITAAVEAIEVR
jgi:phosphate transport system substrate-binding protein